MSRPGASATVHDPEITVIGASGFVGSHLVTYLAGCGYNVRAVSRKGRRHPDWPDSVHTFEADVTTGRGLPEPMAGASAVVHLVAIPRGRFVRTFRAVNLDGTRRVVDAAVRTGITLFVHVSALGARDDPALRFLSSKFQGERLVCESRLDWSVLRPSLLFGEGDGFFALLRTVLAWMSPGVVAIPGDGGTRFQPLSVRDLALGIERCLADPARGRCLYEIGGPAQLTYDEIVDLVMEVTGKRRRKLHVPLAVLKTVTAVTDRVVPFFPVTSDQIRSLGVENIAALDSFQRAFGVPPRPIDLSYLASG